MSFREYILIHVSDHKRYHRNENGAAEMRKMKSSDDDSYARGKHPNDDEAKQEQADIWQ